jgi:hypothetical protein
MSVTDFLRMTTQRRRDLIAWMRLSICSLLTGLYQTHRMGLMQISGLGGADIVGGEKRQKRPHIDLIAMNVAEICLGRTSANHLTQHLKFLIQSVPLPPH